MYFLQMRCGKVAAASDAVRESRTAAREAKKAANAAKKDSSLDVEKMAGLLEKSMAQRDADRAGFHNEFLAKEEEMKQKEIQLHHKLELVVNEVKAKGKVS